jgi:hypothetical protein
MIDSPLLPNRILTTIFLSFWLSCICSLSNAQPNVQPNVQPIGQPNTQSSPLPNIQPAPQPDASTALHQEALRQTQSIQNGGKNWPTVATEFFTIHHQPTTPPGHVATKELDRFVAETLDLWEVPETFRSHLRQNKMAYYLCDDATVTRLTGYQTKGMADLAGRAVISSHYPHFHELVHLLVHLMQETPPAQTHPLVQEGIACLLGGRWGRSPDIVLYTGWVHQNFGMGALDDIMTQADFHTFSGGADVAYPMAAMLCEMVRREAGWSGVLALNEELSGSLEKVVSLRSEDVVAAIAEICQWGEADSHQRLSETMAALWLEYRRCGIAPVDTMPTGKLFKKALRGTGAALVWEEDNRHFVKLFARDYPAYILAPPTDSDWGFSTLFTEHFPDQSYQGQRYGLRFSSDNISLYDFATNQLVATWVAGFTDEMSACDGQPNCLDFEITEPWTAALTSFMAGGSKIHQ